MIYGYWDIKDQETDELVHTIAVHSKPDTSGFDRAERGLFRKVDFERFYVNERGFDEPPQEES